MALFEGIFITPAVTYAEDTGLTMKEARKISQTMDNPDILALKGHGQFQRFKAANAVHNYLENWHVSDFHINIARGSKDAASYADHLSVTGDNLQLVANHLFENHKDTFDEIIAKMKERVPGIGTITPEPTADGRLLLYDRNSLFVKKNTTGFSNAPRPPAPSLRRNMLRRREGAGGREIVKAARGWEKIVCGSKIVRGKSKMS